MPSENKKIIINGITLAYREYGSGDKVLLSAQNFFFEDCHMALLGQPPYDYHVFLIYTRGYGDSEHIFQEIPDNYAKIWGEDVIAFAQAMGIERFYYSGVSHGNWAGWYIAFFRPELLRGFVCCDGIAQYREPNRNAAPGYGRLPVDEIVGNREALAKMAWIERWPTENPGRLKRRKENQEAHLEILMNRKREEFFVMNNDMSACGAASQEELDDRLRKIPVPVMLINGGKDEAARPEAVLHTALLIPGARMLLYQHLGHGGPDECPEMVARDCHRFFLDSEGEIL